MQWRPQRLRAPNTWQVEGFPTEVEAQSWADRACGPVCVQAVISHFTGREVPLWELISKGRQGGGYGPQGWVHAGLAKILRRYGVRAEAKAIAAAVRPLEEALAGDRVLICSVGIGYPMDGSKGGHLVVAYAFKSAPCATLSLMDPADYGPQVTSWPVDRFLPSFSGRVIACRR